MLPGRMLERCHTSGETQWSLSVPPFVSSPGAAAKLTLQSPYIPFLGGGQQPPKHFEVAGDF